MWYDDDRKHITAEKHKSKSVSQHLQTTIYSTGMENLVHFNILTVKKTESYTVVAVR